MYKKRKNIISSSDDSNDSDSEVEASAPKRAKTSSSPPQSLRNIKNQNTSDSDTSDDDDEWTMGSKKKKKKITNKKQQKGRSTKTHLSKDTVISSASNSSSDDSDVEDTPRRAKIVNRSPEDGELSSSSSDDGDRGRRRNNHHGDEVSGSDDNEELELDEEELRKEFDDGYDAKLVGDEEDQKRLEGMTEKEREQELYNRLEKREALEKRFEIEKKLRIAKLKERENQKKKKKIPSFEKSSSPPTGKAASRNERRRKMEEKKEKKTLEDLKAERERKKNKQGAAETKKREVLKFTDIYSSDDADEEVDEKVSMSKSRMEGRVSDSESSASDSDNSSHSDSSDNESAEAKNVMIETKDQLSKIRMTRNELGKWVHHPSFKQIVLGCYVRVGIGNNADRPVYRIAEITDVCETGKVYMINTTKTNVGLRLKHGQQERVFRIAFVSNADFSESEFNKWKQAMTTAGLQLPGVDDIKKKTISMQKQKAQKMQDSDIDHIVKQKQKFRKNPFNYAMKKTVLLKEKEMAETMGDSAESARVEAQLAELEERAEKLDKQRQENIAGITYINDQIKSYNLVKEQAAIDEFKMRQKNVADPFTRRRCKPVIVSNTEDGEQTARLLKEMERRYAVPETDQKDKKTESEKSAPTSEQLEKKSELAQDLFDAHNFDIKLDLEISSSAEPAFTTPKVSLTNPGSDSAPRRSLNLSDYKKRRGLI